MFLSSNSKLASKLASLDTLRAKKVQADKGSNNYHS